MKAEEAEMSKQKKMLTAVTTTITINEMKKYFVQENLERNKENKEILVEETVRRMNSA